MGNNLQLGQHSVSVEYSQVSTGNILDRGTSVMIFRSAQLKRHRH